MKEEEEENKLGKEEVGDGALQAEEKEAKELGEGGWGTEVQSREGGGETKEKDPTEICKYPASKIKPTVPSVLDHLQLHIQEPFHFILLNKYLKTYLKCNYLDLIT